MKSWHYNALAIIATITWWGLLPKDIQDATNNYGNAWILLCILVINVFAIAAKND